MDEYTTFQSFATEEEADQLAELLLQNDIDSLVARSRPITDEMIIGQDMQFSFHVKIHNSEFKRANEVIETRINDNLSKIGTDYYLYALSNDELKEIIHKPDQWSRQDFFIAKRILTERGIAPSEKDISEIKWNRIKEIGSPEHSSTGWIVVGYIASLGGVFGLFFGLTLVTSKTILPDGNKVYAYDKWTRDHGQNMIIISSILIASAVITYIYRELL